MGFKKDDPCDVQKSSFNHCVVFLPVSTLRGTDQGRAVFGFLFYNFIDQAVLLGLFRIHEIIALRVPFNFVFILPGM